MLISVIIPVYNIEKYIGDCIESVLRQDHRELEIILVDDGSTDSSGSICDRYAEADDRIKVFHTENGGLSAARNFGTKQATGEFVYYLDGDDMFADGAISSSAAKITGNVDAVLAKFATFDTDTGKLIPEPFTLKEEYVKGKSGEAGLIRLFDNIDRPIWAAWRPLFRRSLMTDNDLWFRPRLLSEDIDIMPHIYCKARELAVNDRVNTLYRVNRSGSIMATVNAKRYTDIYWIINKWVEFLKADTGYSEEFHTAMQRQMELLYFSYMKKLPLLNKNNKKEVITAAKKLSYLLDSKYIPKKYRLIYRMFGFGGVRADLRLVHFLKG